MYTCIRMVTIVAPRCLTLALGGCRAEWWDIVQQKKKQVEKTRRPSALAISQTIFDQDHVHKMEGTASRFEEEQLHGNFLWHRTHISLFATLKFDNKIPPSTL